MKGTCLDGEGCPVYATTLKPRSVHRTLMCLPYASQSALASREKQCSRFVRNFRSYQAPAIWLILVLPLHALVTSSTVTLDYLAGLGAAVEQHIQRQHTLDIGNS